VIFVEGLKKKNGFNQVECELVLFATVDGIRILFPGTHDAPFHEKLE